MIRCDIQKISIDKELILELVKQYWWIGTILLVLVIATIIFLTVRTRIRKRKGKELGVKIRQRYRSASDNIVTLRNKPGERIKLVIYHSGKKISAMDVVIDSSLIVGRSDLSDMYLEDEQLSRQHFILEYDGEDYYVEDLQTTNGTLLNGVLLQERTKLNNNDKIKAGSTEIVVRW